MSPANQAEQIAASNQRIANMKSDELATKWIKSQKVELFATFNSAEEMIKEYNLEPVTAMILINTVLDQVASKIAKGEHRGHELRAFMEGQE